MSFSFLFLWTLYSSFHGQASTVAFGIIDPVKTPYDNACIESFHSILKKEEVNHSKYYDFNVARKAIFEFIESWYNRKRIHGSINDMTPHAAHEAAA